MAKEIKNTVNLQTKHQVFYEIRSFLGLFSWRVEVSSTELKDDLYIEVPSLDSFKRVFINGNEIKK